MDRSRWLAVAWTLLILVLCWTPRGSLPISEHAPSLLHQLHVDKFVHFGIFAVFAALWRRNGGRRATPLIAIAGIALAIRTELGQETTIVNRDGDFWDGLADSAGVFVGLVFAGYLARRKAGPAQSDA